MKPAHALVIMLGLILFLTLPILATRVKSGAPPVAPVASFTYSPDIPGPGETIIFNASSSYDPDGWIAKYTWDFGEGNVTTVTTPIITHQYAVDGNYTIELTVTDNSGLTGVACAVIQVKTVVFFRVCVGSNLIPLANVQVTVYYYNGISWVTAPVGPSNLQIKYDNKTQPNLANTDAQRNRNPGYTASILRQDASNIGFDVHPSCWTVYFKFQYGPFVAYWPNTTTTVYSYKKGVIETHNYLPGHQAYWDATISKYVIEAGDIPSHGVSPTEEHPILVCLPIAPPPTQKYYLTVRTAPSGITTIPGQGFYLKGTNVSLTAPAYVNVSTSTCYRFSYWDVDGTSKGVGVNPITVCMSANHTATSHYIMQYSVVFTQTGLSSDATGTIVTVNGIPETLTQLPYTLWVDSGGSVTYSYTSVVPSSVSGKQFKLSSVTGPSSPITVADSMCVIGPMCVTCSVCVTGCYTKQYSVTFAQTGLDSTATGTVVTVNGNAKTYSQLPYVLWVDCVPTVTYSYNSTVSSTTSGKRFRLNSVTGPSSPITVTGPTTVTGNYIAQYLLTFAQTGLDSTASGTVVSINGSAKIFSSLPFSWWVDSGSSVSYSYTSIVPSTLPNKQFRLSSVTGPTSSISVSGPATVTGNYVAQYLVTFAQTGLDATATGTVVTVNGGAKGYGALPFTMWVDSGGSVTYTYNPTVSSSTAGKQFRLNTVSGPTSSITINGATTVTGNYVAQYLVTFAQTGLDATATGTVVTVNGGAKGYGALPFTMWVDSGGSVTYTYNPTVSSSTAGKQFRLNTVTGPISSITVTAATTVTGNYGPQYLVTFTSTGLDSSATGSVVTVNGNPKQYADLPLAFWVNSSSSVTYSYNDIVLSTVLGKQFKQVSVTGPASPITVTSSVTVTGNYKTQYQVIFDQTGVGIDFPGRVVTIDGTNYNISSLPTTPQFWWDKNSSHSFSFASPLTVNGNKQYVWSSTSGSGLSTLQSGTITITTSGSVVGNYIVQHSVTFDQLGVDSDFTGTVVIIDGTSYGVTALPKSFNWTLGSSHTFAYQSPLVVTADVKKYVWTNTTGLSTLESGSMNVTSYGTIIGHYKTQYYLALAANPSVTSPSGAGWYDAGTYATASTSQYVYGGSRYRFAGWTTAGISEITDPTSPSTTVLVDKAKTLTASYIHQYLVTFTQTGLAIDANGTVITINSTSKTYSDLSYSIWVDQGSTVNYLYATTVASTTTGKQFNLFSVTGPLSPITVTADTNVTGNYKTQYYLTVSSPYGTTGGQGWYNSSATAYASLNTGTVDQGNGTRRVFTYWNVNASGTNYAKSDPITMNGPKTAVARWKTQYSVTFAQTGLDSTASGTVVVANGTSNTFGDLAHTLWVDSGGSVTYSYNNVSSSTTGKRFVLMGVTGLPSPINLTSPMTVTGNYKTQYRVSFSQSGVGSDFTGTVVTVDGTDYTLSTLPTASFWWDNGSSHAFLFASPLTVNASRSYLWISTSGLSTCQNDTLIITSSGSVTGNYSLHIKHQVTFSQTGVGVDFTGTIVVIDGSNYKVADLNVSFWWDDGSVHNFTYQSPLTVTPNAKQYVWVSTSGLSTSQSGSITVSGSGSVTGNYKTQYYLTLATSPSGVNSPSGTRWYDAGTNATISTTAFVDIVPGSSRYRFNGWTTADMTEITDFTRSPTTVLMEKAKTVTASYVVQYNVTLSKSGVGTDFTGTVVIIDGRNYDASFWWDVGSLHTYAYQSPLVVSNSKQYVWTSTTGLSTLQSGSITASGSGSVTGNYKTQYYLTVKTDPASITTIPGEGSYDTSSNATLNAPAVAGYQFNYWDVDGVSQGNGVDPIMVTMKGPHTATAHYTPTPVGGYSISLAKQTPLSQIAAYIMLTALSSMVLILKKRKRK